MPGFAAFFKKSSEEERAHGLKLVEYQNKRGGKVVFQDIARPSATEWGTPLEALEAALELEKTVSILEASQPRHNLPIYAPSHCIVHTAAEDKCPGPAKSIQRLHNNVR